MATRHQWEMAARNADHEDHDHSPATVPTPGPERRSHRRYDLEQQGISIDRYDGRPDAKQSFGQVIDLSAAGVRIRTGQGSIHPDQQIRVRLELPDHAGICPFVDTSRAEPRPTRQWVGWMAVARVESVGRNRYEVAGRLVDMEAMDRGMLGLYLSTQPIAA